VLKRYVPEGLVERPKMGFGVPIGAWLRGPLRDWAEQLLATRTLEADGLFDPRPIRACWQAHLDGRADHEYRLWAVLMFQSWRQRAAQ
jgi:asparagine synthase (glutamine-hydrolysing)